jgi:hypothetical protein
MNTHTSTVKVARLGYDGTIHSFSSTAGQNELPDLPHLAQTMRTPAA